MKAKNALKWICGIALVGLLFSGYLSYKELFGGCSAGCPTIAVNTVFGYPACVYGFVMYAIVLLISGLGLSNK